MMFGSTPRGMVFTKKEARAKRSEARLVPGRNAVPPTVFQYCSMAS
jgi:hypothetical protein